MHVYSNSGHYTITLNAFKKRLKINYQVLDSSANSQLSMYKKQDFHRLMPFPSPNLYVSDKNKQWTLT